jgi:RNA recognition motif-containing protein
MARLANIFNQDQSILLRCDKDRCERSSGGGSMGIESSLQSNCLWRIAGKSRGYAFIEYEHKNDMKLAYKNADGKKIEGKRVVVDVERGRTVPTW